MKKFLALLLVMLLAIGMLAGCGGSSEPAEEPADDSATEEPAADETAEPINVTYASYGNSKMPPQLGVQDAIAYINENSNLVIDYKGDAVLGGEADTMQQVMDGTIQIACLSLSQASLYTTVLDCAQLPFLIGDYETERAAFNSDEWLALFDEAGEAMGVKILPMCLENGIRHFANNVRPVEKLADLKGLKLRIAPTQILQTVMEALGASPMVVNYNEVYSALQNNVVDGEEINITSIYALKHYEQLKYISKIGMYPYPEFTCVNLDFWNSLTPENQQVIIDGFDLAEENCFSKYLADLEVEAEQACLDAGVEINTIEGDARQEFVDTAMPLWDDVTASSESVAAFVEKVKELNAA